MDDPVNDEPRPGLFGSLRSLVDRVIAVFHNRAALFTTELEEEARRFVGVIAWMLVAVLASLIAAAFVGFAVVLFIPAAARPWVASALALVFVLVATVAGVSIRKIARAKPRPFDASLRELEKDREHLRGGR